MRVARVADPYTHHCPTYPPLNSSGVVEETMDLGLSNETLEATFAELTHLLVIPARLTLEKAELGVGGFGEVCLATLDKSSEFQRQVAVKQLRIVQAWDDRRRIALRLARELKVWAKVKHPNILELIGYYLSENYVCAQLISAFMANGNVMQYIQRNHVSAAIRLKFVQDIAAGLTYLHDSSPPICHGDLKPANVLVNEGLDAVLCDFGLSSFIHESDVASGLTTSKSIKGSPRYMSPELILQDHLKHTLQSDVWAWGCTAFEIMTESSPYSTKTNPTAIIVEIFRKTAPGSIDALNTMIVDTGVNPACHTGVSSLRSIIPQCWDFDPTQRPSASRILQCTTISYKPDGILGASVDQEGGISSLHIQDDSGHGGGASQEQTYVAPYRRHTVCMNCQQYPKVGGRDFCSDACLDNASSRLSASAQSKASSQRFAVPNLSNLSSTVTYKLNPPHSMRADLPKEREPISQENGIAHQNQERSPQAVAKTIKLCPQTASAPGKNADMDRATSPTTSGNSDLGEGLKKTSQAKHADTRQASPSREKPKQNENSGARTRPFNTVAQGASEDSQPFIHQHQPSIFKKILSMRRFRLPKTPGQAPFLPLTSVQYRQKIVSAQPDEGLEPHRHSSWVQPSAPGCSLPTSPDPDIAFPNPSNDFATLRIRPRLEIDELRDGLLSAIGTGWKRLDALDRTGQLKERTKPKFTGGFSDVSHAKLGDRAVAVKALRVTSIGAGESPIWKGLAREIYVWATLDHPNVLELLGFAIEDGIPCLISPWCDNGTLQEYLQKFPDANRRRLVREIAEGLRYLHVQTPPIIHGDVKTTNVFVTGDDVAKISDSGGSRRIEDLRTGFTTAGLVVTTTRYTAPEILRDGEEPTLCSDVFSFACVALETMTDKCPFWKIPHSAQIVTQVVFQKQMPSPADHPGMEEAIWELLRRCWHYKPSDRPKMIDVCQTLSGAA